MKEAFAKIRKRKNSENAEDIEKFQFPYNKKKGSKGTWKTTTEGEQFFRITKDDFKKMNQIFFRKIN